MNTSGKNIVLVGFMGTGKSRCGRMLADRLGYTFLDMDDVLEERAGKSIPEIFAEDGEPRFREMESGLALELSGRSGLVIAAGGGVVLNPANIQAFHRGGVVVCLRACPETILARVEQASHRPLLEDGEKADRIRALLKQREPLYAAIPNQVDTTALSPEEVVEAIIGIYQGETGHP